MAYVGEDLDKEVAVTIAQFVLKPDIPEQEKAYFQRFYVMFSKIAALGNTSAPWHLIIQTYI